MSWKPMDTAPKDGTVIVVYADQTKLERLPDVFLAFYAESEGHWDSLAEDAPLRQAPFIRELTTLQGWIKVPDSSPLAGTKVYRDGELAREPGKLHFAKVK